MYRSIAQVTGARVVVDSSRLPIEPVALGLVPGVDVRVAQLIRDPRAVVYSWKRSKRLPDRDSGEYMDKFSASFSTASWLVRNLVVEAIRRRGPVEVVQYDEMARDPAKVLRQLAAFVGEPAGDMEFLTSETATLATDPLGGRQPGADEERRDRDRARRGMAPRASRPATGRSAPRSHCRCSTATDCRFAPARRPTGVTRRRVLVIGSFDPTTPRSRQWLRLLDRLGCDVEVRNVGSWGNDRAAQSAGSPAGMLRNALGGLWRGARYLLTCKRPDVVVFLYPGHLDACVLGPIARIRRIPAVLDVFISLHDTVVVDRGLRGPRSPVGLATRARSTCSRAGAFRSSWSTHPSTPSSSRASRAAAGGTSPCCGSAPRRPGSFPSPIPATTRAFSGISPTSRCTASRPSRVPPRCSPPTATSTASFRLIGDGQQRAEAEELASRGSALTQHRVRRAGAGERAPGRDRACVDLPRRVRHERQGARVVPNKVFQCAAAGRPIVTAATPAIETAFGDALVTVPVGDPAALATAIRDLRGPARLEAAARGPGRVRRALLGGRARRPTSSRSSRRRRRCSRRSAR